MGVVIFIAVIVGLLMALGWFMDPDRKRTQSVRKALLIAAGLIAVLIAITVIYQILLGSAPSAPQKPRAAEAKVSYCENGRRATIVAHRLVTRRLKSPKTAEFPSYDEAITRHMGNCVHRVISYVDSQNGFGAMIRTTFAATIDMTNYDADGGILVDIVTDSP